LTSSIEEREHERTTKDMIDPITSTKDDKSDINAMPEPVEKRRVLFICHSSMSRQSRGLDAMPNQKITPDRAPSKIGDPHEHKKDITSKKEKVRMHFIFFSPNPLLVQ